MNSPVTFRDPVLEAAADWMLRLQDSTITAEDIARWTAWCAEDSEHLRAFRDVQSLWQSSRGILEKPVGVQELAADRYAGEMPISQWRTAQFPAAPSRRKLIAGSWKGLGALAASLLVALGVTAYFVTRADFKVTAATGVNQQLQLADRSVVILAAGSTLRAKFHADAREVYLDRGEAFFEVQKDPLRPFTVHAFGRSITAIGTAFNVRAEEGIFRVAVTEGAVDILGAGGEKPRQRLSAGEQISLAPDQIAPRLARIDASRATSWRNGNLQFVDEPLSSVVAAVSRYSRAAVTLQNPELGSLRFTGTVNVTRIDEWLQGLSNIFPVVVQRQGADEEVLIRTATR